MKRRLFGVAWIALCSTACPSTPAANGAVCENSGDCNGARCVFVAQGVGHCEGGSVPPVAGEGEGEGTAPPPPSGEGEGEGTSPVGEGEGEGASPVGEGEGEGEVAPSGEGEGEGGPVDVTPHFFPGAFVGGASASSSAHFSLIGNVGSSRRE